MFRIDDPSAVGSRPTPAAAGTPGYFTEGNPGAGLPATRVTADWLNMFQEEIMSVLTAGGITPSKTTVNQLLAAIKAVAIGQFSQSLVGAQGYVILPNGLIVQWGGASASTVGQVNTFPLAFPTICAQVVLTTAASSSTIPVSAVWALTKTNFQIFCSSGTPSVSWWAVGW